MQSQLGLTTGGAILYAAAIAATLGAAISMILFGGSVRDALQAVISPWIVAGLLAGLKWCVALPFRRWRPNFKLDLAWMALIFGLINLLVIAAIVLPEG